MSHCEATHDAYNAGGSEAPFWVGAKLGRGLFLHVSGLAAGNRLERLILTELFSWEITQMTFSFPVQDIQHKREVELNTEAKIAESRVLVLSSSMAKGKPQFPPV